MKFRVGDVVEVVHVYRPELHAALVGETATVVALGQTGMWDAGEFRFRNDLISIANDSGHLGRLWSEEQLRLKRPPSWDEWLTSESHLTAEDKREDRQKERV